MTDKKTKQIIGKTCPYFYNIFSNFLPLIHLFKVAEHSFSRALLLMRFSVHTRIAKTNMLLIQRSFYLLNARSIFAIFFTIDRSALMALVFYNKGMLEKVTMQSTQQFSDFSESKEPS